MPSTRKILSASSTKKDNLAPSKWDHMNPLYCGNQTNRYVNTSVATNLGEGTHTPLALTPNNELTTQYFCAVIPYVSGGNFYVPVWSVNYSTNTISVCNSSTSFTLNDTTNLRPKRIKDGDSQNYSINLSNNMILTGKVASGTIGTSLNISFQALIFNPSTNAVTLGTMANVNVSNLYGASWYQINSTAVILHYSNGTNGTNNSDDYLRVVTVNPSTGAITFNTENRNQFGFYRYGQKNASGLGAQVYQNQSVVMCNTSMGFIIKAASAVDTNDSVVTQKFTLSGTTVTRETPTGSISDNRLPGIWAIDPKTSTTNLVQGWPLLRYPVLLSKTSNVGVSNTFCFIDGLYTNGAVVPSQTEGYFGYTLPMFRNDTNNILYKEPTSGVTKGVQFSNIFGEDDTGTLSSFAKPSYGLSHYFVKTTNEDIRILFSGSMQNGITNFLQLGTIAVNCAVTPVGASVVLKCQSNSINMIEVQGAASASGVYYPNAETSIVSTLQGTDRGFFQTVAANGSSTTCQVVGRFLSANVNSSVSAYQYSNTYVAPRAGNVFIQVYGKGGFGNSTNPSSGTSYPGGGGGFSNKNMSVTSGQNISINFGTTSVSVNTISVGYGGNSSTTALGGGGVATGGDVNADGTLGATGTYPNPGVSGQCGVPGPSRSGFGWSASHQVYGNRATGGLTNGILGIGSVPWGGSGQPGAGFVYIGIK